MARKDLTLSRSEPITSAAPPHLLLILTVATALASCETESTTGNPTREMLPNGAVLARYSDLPATDSDVAQALVDLKFGSVDGTDPNLAFGAIRGVQAAHDGSIYVLDRQAAEVRVFDSGGRYLRTIVRRGEGPGEIMDANGILLSGDTLLWIHDIRRWTIIGVDPAGEEIRRFIKPVMSHTPTWTGAFDNRGRYWNDILHSDEVPSDSPPPGLSSSTGRHYHKSYDLSSGVIDSVYLGEVGLRSYAYSTPDHQLFFPLWFEASELVAVNPFGGFWRANSASYRIARIDERRDTVVVVEAEMLAQPVTDEDRAAYVESFVEAHPDFRREAAEVAALMPDVKPMLADIFVDDEGRLWVQRVTPDDGPAFYDLFSEDGDYLDSVRLAFKAVGPIWVQHGNIYARIVDELDVQFVVRASLSRRSGTPG